MQQLASGLLPSRVDSATDGVDVADVVRVLKRQWRAVMSFLALGVVTALAVVLFAPRRFEGRATLLARGGAGETGGSILSRITGIGGLMTGGAFGGLPSPFESELQVLKSRSVGGEVVDSLQLQFSVRAPSRVPPTTFIAASSLPGRFKPRTYTFDRKDRVYVVHANDSSFTFVPGTPGRLDVGTITLQRAGLPPTFTVKVFDREDAITRLSTRLTITKAGGEVARIVYNGEDSLSAAAVPNLIVSNYLMRRRTVDRGTNQRRLEYVTQQYDSTARQLGATEHALRDYQESSKILDAEAVGQAWLEGAVALRESLTTVTVDEQSIRTLVDRADKGTISPRQLAAYPAFLRGTPFMTLSQQLSELEAQRLKLAEHRTDKDPDVQVLDQNIASVEAQMLSLARSYAGALTQQRAQLSHQLDSLQASLLTLPIAAERGGRMKRDIIRLSAIFTALQAQLVEARLAAIGEGGDVRQIDVAVPPRKPSFPQPLVTMGIGTFGGLVAGCVAALFLGWFGRWFRDPVEIERATGVAVQRFDKDSPLLITGSASRTFLVVPLAAGAQTDAVAQRLAHTATARALRTNILDLSGRTNGNGAEGVHPLALIERMEAEGDVVVVQLPALSSDATVAAMRETRPVLLVAPPGPVDRLQLNNALALLRRFGAPCAGVVMSDDVRHGIRA